jgi:outer membrane receptor for ferrienterochelin and colicin
MTSVNPFEFWQLNASYSIFESEITSGDYEGDALKDQYKWSAKAINDFKLPYKTNLQLSFNAVGPKVSATKEESTIWFADLGIEKKLVKGGSLFVWVSDVFDSLAKEKTELTDKSSTYEYETTMGRIFMVGIKYRF